MSLFYELNICPHVKPLDRAGEVHPLVEPERIT